MIPSESGKFQSIHGILSITNYITDLEWSWSQTLRMRTLVLRLRSLYVWVLEFKYSLTLWQISAQPSYTFNATDLALCSALFKCKVVCPGLNVSILKASFWRLQFWRLQFLKTSTFMSLFFQDFSFWRPQVFNCLAFNFWRLWILKI